MKLSRRAKRMQRNHARNKQGSGLNLVSLMDIFTILVFFLMVNQSDVEVVSNDAIKLPASTADVQPKNNVVLLVSGEDIIVQGRPIVKVKDALAKENEEVILELRKELDYLASRRPFTEDEEENGRAITIMGDHKVPYKLLKRIMTTCQKAKYAQLSLAVSQQVAGGPK